MKLNNELLKQVIAKDQELLEKGFRTAEIIPVLQSMIDHLPKEEQAAYFDAVIDHNTKRAEKVMKQFEELQRIKHRKQYLSDN